MKLIINDVAKITDISLETISKVMNRAGSFSDRPIEKVKNSNEETRYQPTSVNTLITTKSLGL